MRTLLRILATVFFSFTATDCIWDAQSFSHEKARSHDLATTILGEPQISENTNQLRATIKELEANRRENDVNWWNNLAGAYLRLNQPQDAVTLLEPVVGKFPDGYGIHANLGTAYHLLGRYQEAEKEIARDLEINPDAHFGLEKYHLALLQYLARDSKYQSRHVYVDEFTVVFLTAYRGWGFDAFYPEEDSFIAKAQSYTNEEAAENDYKSLVATNAGKRPILYMLGTLAMFDAQPEYRKQWDLLRNENMEAGVIYMAQMNPKEPACYVMLGIDAWKKQDFHLAITAFDRAVALGSPQSELLKEKVDDLREFIRISEGQKRTMHIIETVIISLPLMCVVWFIRQRVRRRGIKILANPS